MAYHINPETGEPGSCSATIKCPFGGSSEHYDTPNEARSAYEKTMEADGYVFKPHKFGAAEFKPATEAELTESREKAKNAYATDFPKGVILTASDKAMLEKVTEGKKVPDAKIDEFLDRQFAIELPGRSSGYTSDGAKAVFDHLRLVRAQSQTPSTLTKLDNFDPATQSVFTAEARKDPAKMAKAITKTLNDVEHLRKLADESYWTADNWEEGNDQEKARLRADAEVNIEMSKRAEVRADAMMTEMKWKLENDKQFASRANPNAVKSALRFRLRENPGEQSIGKVRKVTGE